MRKIDIIKIVIVVVAVLLIGFVAYKYIGGEPTVPPEPDTQQKDKYKDLVAAVEAKINREIVADDSSQLVITVEKYPRIMDAIDYYFDAEEASGYKMACVEKLRQKFQDKFIEQSFYVFTHTDWFDADIKAIRKNVTLVESFGLDNENKLARIKSIVADYDAVNSYLANVRKYSSPKTLSSKWVDKCRLVNEIYVPHDELVRKNYSECDKLKKSYVRDKIYEQHKSFVDALVVMLEKAASDDEFTSVRDWEFKASSVYDEVKAFTNASRDCYEISYGSRDAASNRYKRRIDNTEPHN